MLKRVHTYYRVPQTGILVGIAVYVNAGPRMATAKSLVQLVSLPMIVSLALLAALPLASRWTIKGARHWRHQRRWHHTDDRMVLNAGVPLVTLIFPVAALAAFDILERSDQIDSAQVLGHLVAELARHAQA